MLENWAGNQPFSKKYFSPQPRIFQFRHHFLSSYCVYVLRARLNQDLTDWVGIIAGLFTALSLLPQLIKLIRNKKAEDISLFFLIILFCGLGLWIWYGVLRNDTPIIVTNAVSLAIVLMIIVLGIRYKKSLTK